MSPKELYSAWGVWTLDSDAAILRMGGLLWLRERERIVCALFRLEGQPS